MKKYSKVRLGLHRNPNAILNEVSVFFSLISTMQFIVYLKRAQTHIDTLTPQSLSKIRLGTTFILDLLKLSHMIWL